jgi:hypothetical protein
MDLTKLVVPITTDNKDFNKGIDEAKKGASGLTSGLAGIGGGIVGAGLIGVTAGIGALTAGVASSIGKTTEWAGTMDGIQDIIGGTNEQAAGLATMVERVGGSSDQVTGAMKKLSMGLVDAKGELGPTGQALQQLGISAFDSNGKMKDAYTIFGEVANATAGMDDGLGKSQVLMDIFGKSGAELGDILSAASSGGMAQFQQEATAMGLAIDPGPVIEQQKAQAKLDQTLSGLQTTIGTAVIPVMGTLAGTLQETLADPEVKKGISDLSKGVGDFFILVIKQIPPVINFLKQLPAFFENNKPLIIGILAALGIAVAAFVYATVIPAIGAAITALIPLVVAFAPVIAVMAVVGVAAGLLYAAWDSNFMGIRDTLTEVWNAIEPIFNWIGDLIGGYVTRQFNNFIYIVQSVIGWFNTLRSTLSSLSLPSWLMPGSPPPLFYALKDVDNQLKKMVTGSLPSFNAELKLQGATVPVGGSQGVASRSNNSDVLEAIGSLNLGFDEERLARLIASSILKAMG